MTDTPTPAVPKALLEWLSKVYPDRCPRPEDSSREVWMAAGRADVVRKLRAAYEDQTKRALENK